MVKRVVVGAHYGLRDWLMQRITAIVMAVYTVVVAVYVLANLPMDYPTWKELFASQWMRVFTLLFLASLYLHAWVGVRDILMDYIQPVAVRLTLQVLVIVSLVAYAFWSVSILWSV